MKINKAIFLDIDGVLALNYGFSLPETEWLMNTAYPFDKPCVDVLNLIIEKTDAEIVLTSQWRVDYTRNELDMIFEWNNINKNPIAITESIGGFTRCLEIERFLEENTVNKFVIIDDMHLECYPQNFIHTIMETALNETHIDKIVKLLNE